MSHYKYYCVVDFEATCWKSPEYDKGSLARPPPEEKKPYEIIEFPSVLFRRDDAGLLVPVSEFRRYCRPVRNPTLSAFCTELTGIEQKSVDDAEVFPVVLRAHRDWLLEQVGGELHSVILLSCGVWDFESALPQELRRWGQTYQLYKQYPELYKLVVDVPDVYRSFINVKDLYTKVYGIKAGGMTTMLTTQGIELEGRHHSGLDDSKNIGKILQKIFVDTDGKVAETLPVRRLQTKYPDMRPMWNHTKKVIPLEGYKLANN